MTMLYPRDVADEMNQMKVGDVYALTDFMRLDMAISIGDKRTAQEIVEDNLIGFNVGCWKVWEDFLTGTRHYKKLE